MKTIGLMLAAMVTFGGPAFAEEKGTPNKAPQMSAEQRSKMAEAHEKMAACLRTDRPLSECHDEMMKSCEAAMGAGNCPMMGGMKHHGGMMHQGQTK